MTYVIPKGEDPWHATSRSPPRRWAPTTKARAGRRSSSACSRCSTRPSCEGVEILAYPEMALTTYFPKRVRDDFDQFFETEMPPKALAPLLQRAREARIACHVGFCEKDQGRYFNTALLTDEAGKLAGTFRKIHLPGAKQPDGHAQVYEPHFFESGNSGYKVFDAAARQGRHRDLPGPALPRVLPQPRPAGRRDRADRLQHAALPAGPRPERALPARGRLPEQPLRGRHRQGRHRGRHGADRRLVHREPDGAGAGQGRRPPATS